MVNNFYVVRNIGCWEVRNSEDPELLWAKCDSEEEAKLSLVKAYISGVVDSRLGQFLEDTAELLSITEEEIKEEIRGLL
jgi:hypothetical protein